MGNGHETSREYHAAEAVRIAGELDDLDSSYTEDGIVRTVLRQRVEQERHRAERGCGECIYCRDAGRI